MTSKTRISEMHTILQVYVPWHTIKKKKKKKQSYTSVLFHSIDAKKTDIAIDNPTTVLVGQVETCDS